MSVKHSPTPWRLVVDDILDANNHEVSIYDRYGPQRAPSSDDAEYIVRCVNAHESLVQALTGLLEWSREDLDDTRIVNRDDLVKLVKRCEDALALAEPTNA